MDVLTAILACSLYRDDALVRAMAESNSHGNPYAVVDATLATDPAKERPAPRSLDAALSAMKKVLEEGGVPLLGVMQVPEAWATAIGKPPSSLFDVCTNIAIGTAKLSEFAYACSRPAVRTKDRRSPVHVKLVETGALRACVVHKYAAAIRMPEFELVVRLELAHQPPSTLALETGSPTAILSEGAFSDQDDRGARRLFFFSVGTANDASSTPSVLVDPFAVDVFEEPHGKKEGVR